MFTVATSWWGLDVALYRNKLETLLGQEVTLGNKAVERVKIAQQYLPLANVSVL